METAPVDTTDIGGENRLRKTILLTAVCVCYFATAWWWIRSFGEMVISREPTTEASTLNLHQLWSFWIGSGVMWLWLTAIYFIIRNNKHSLSTMKFVRTTVLIMLAGLVMRGAVVLTHQPGLSDDIWRYVFDGEVLAAGHNPYVTAPKEVEREHERFPGEYTLAHRVNNPELTTIYLPVSQIVFAISAKAARWTKGGRARTPIDPQREAMVFRWVFIGFEIGTMVLLALVLYSMKKSAWFLTLYAWHPLALSEIAGAGHQDVIGLFFMVAALALWRWRSRWKGRWSTLVALSALVKPMSVLVPAFQLRYDRARGRDWTRSLGVGVVICALFTVPFFFIPNTQAWTHFTGTVDRFVHSWAFFGSVYIPLLKLTGSEEWARRILVLILGGVVLLMMMKRSEPWQASRDIFFAGVLLSTTAWPWYLLWALVLLPIRPSAGLWTATLTIPWGYAVLGDVAGWTIPGWVMWLAYGPVYGVLLMELYYYLRRNHDRATTHG